MRVLGRSWGSGEGVDGGEARRGLHGFAEAGKRKAMMCFTIRLLAAAGLSLLAVGCASKPKTTAVYRGNRAALVNGRAVAPAGVPRAVRAAIAAGNRIQKVPYQYGGGHGRPSRGLDCSGSVSYVLKASGLLASPLTSGEFRRYGTGGVGRYITVYGRDGHVFMTVCGLRLDTSNSGNGHAGPRWSTKPRNVRGFTARHPRGY
jgi:hypothetical protein